MNKVIQRVYTESIYPYNIMCIYFPRVSTKQAKESLLITIFSENFNFHPFTFYFKVQNQPSLVLFNNHLKFLIEF